MALYSPPAKPSSPFASMRGDHAGLRVADLDAALAWYGDKLDFRCMSRMTFNGLVFLFISPPDNDDFRLELLAGPGATDRPAYENLVGSLSLHGWHHVCLRVDSVDASVSELRRRGVEILAEPTDIPEIRRRIAFFADPWGNLIELNQPMTK